MWYAVYGLELPYGLPDGGPAEVYQGYIQHSQTGERVEIEDRREADLECAKRNDPNRALQDLQKWSDNSYRFEEE